jgi:catechol 2,3-dioxygenase-like lactoylglutathione lyase family enzyme
MNSSDPIKELPLAPRAVTHIGLTVTDLDQAIAFYEKVFGFRVVFGPTRFQSDDPQFGAIPSDFFGADFKSTRVVFLTGANGVVLEIFEFESPKTIRSKDNFQYWKTGFFHICIVDPDVTACAARVAEHGGLIRSKVWDLFPGKPYQAVYTEDPFGNVIELYSHSTEQMVSNLMS